MAVGSFEVLERTADARARHSLALLDLVRVRVGVRAWVGLGLWLGLGVALLDLGEVRVRVRPSRGVQSAA